MLVQKRYMIHGNALALSAGSASETPFPSSFNSHLSTINYPVAGPPRKAPPLTASPSPHQRTSVHFRFDRAYLRDSSPTRASSSGVATVGHTRTNTLLLHDHPPYWS
jgi:hypothetical protein